jgi:hypothetical protein
MVPFQMVMLGILGNDESEMALAQRNDLGQAPRLDGTHEPLRIGVQVRASHRQPDGLDTPARRIVPNS